MAEWDPEVEDVMKEIRLPDETLPVDLNQQAKLMCGVGALLLTGLLSIIIG